MSFLPTMHDRQHDAFTTPISESGNSFVDTGLSITTKLLPSPNEDGLYEIKFNSAAEHSLPLKDIEVQIVIDGTPVAESVMTINSPGAGKPAIIWTQACETIGDGLEIKVQFRNASGIGTATLNRATLCVDGLASDRVV